MMRYLYLSAAMTLFLATQGLGQISGIVLESGSLVPVGGAIVAIQASPQKTTTAADGSFTLSGLSGTNFEVVAAKKGYFHAPIAVPSAPTAGIVIMIQPVLLENNTSYTFPAPTFCASCHPNQFSEWTGSPMAMAGSNTWVYDIYDGTGTPGGMGGFVYTRDSAFAAGHPNSECASCHQPEPWIENPGKALDPVGSLSTGSMHGISCETCHKIANLDETKPNYPGIWPGVVDFNRPNNPTSHQVEYGVLGDASYNVPGLMQPSYQPQLTAVVCAACHQDKNDPDGNGNFEEPNGVISEPTYLEWLASPYGNPSSPQYRSCVECHMPPTGASSICSIAPVTRDPATIHTHRIEGTTPFFLENAVDLTMTVQENPTDIQISVSIHNNQTGHHVPTGVTVRNMILLVEAWRVSDGQMLTSTGTQTIHALGGTGDPNQGYYAGLPGKLFAKVNHDANGVGPTFFTDATGITFDNRIPAMATDVTNYSFSVPPGSGRIMARARLIYRRAFRGFVDAKQWTQDGHGRPLEDLQAPHFGHLMEGAEWTSGSGVGPVVSFGASCQGLVASSLITPSIGQSSLEMNLSGALPGVQAVLFLGTSNTQWGPYALPLDLTNFGGPGCFLNVNPVLDYPTTTNALGDAQLLFDVPHLPSIVGGVSYSQWISADPMNPLLPYATSNGLAITIQP